MSSVEAIISMVTRHGVWINEENVLVVGVVFMIVVGCVCTIIDQIRVRFGKQTWKR